jgi:arylsulfatase A-like enzyme
MNPPTLSRRDFVKTTALGTAGAALAAPASFGIQTSKTARPPNIVFIFTDQQHIDTISALGCRDIHTPGMDRLAREGVSFTQSYCPSPVCGPCRAAVYSGRMPSEIGVTTNGDRPDPAIPLMGDWFRDHGGYETLYMGKWHVPQYITSKVPGFEVLFCGNGGPGTLADSSYTFAAESFFKNYSGSKPFIMAINYMQPHDICEWLRLNRLGHDALPFPELESQLPDLPGNFTIPELEPEMVAERRRRNEGAYTGWDDMHWRYYRWAYYRHVEMVDAEIQRVIQGLETSRHCENTLIVFSSDHGEGMGHHMTVRKSLLYDQTARVPLILHWPGRIRRNHVNRKDLVSGVDILPTLCDFAGIPAPPKHRGRSLRPFLESDGKAGHDFITSEISGNRGQMFRTGRYKYITYHDDPVEQLFDMETDPGETQNLARDSRFTSALEDHRAGFKDWVQSLDVSPKLETRWFGS